MTMVLRSHRWSVALALLLRGCLNVSTSAQNGECYDSLDPIRAAEQSLQDDSSVRTYVLCPETVFPVAKSFNQDGIPKTGQYPLILGRSNIHVLCGVDGKSENGCVLSGGLFQVGFFDEFQTGNPAKNVLVQGLTFYDAKNTNVLAENKGDITIRDCIFQDNHNISPVYAEDPLQSDPNRRRQLAREVVPAHNWERKAVETNQAAFSMSVTITSCVFQDNIIWAYSGASVDGLIVLRGGSMTIADTTFISTTIESNEMKLAFLISNAGGNLMSHTNCFLDNDPRIVPIVTEQGNIQAISSFVQRQVAVTSPTGCDFTASVTNGTLSRMGFEDVAFACTDSDAQTCGAASVKRVKVPCIDILNDVYQAESVVTDDSIVRTYLLCPKTTFKVATMNDNVGNPFDGSHPIIINRPNMRILCGAEGNSENNCVVSGGVFQLGIVDEFGTGGPPATNALVSGITFTGASSVNVQATFPSHVVLSDCIFKNNANLASISLVGPNTAGSRRLVTGRSGTLDSRGLELVEAGPSIEVVDCSFDGNVIGTISGQSSGIIVNRNATLSVRQSTFINTENRSRQQYMAYVILNIQGTLELIGNCFAQNEVTIAPVIGDGGSIEASMNSGNKDAVRTSGCEFVALFTSADDTKAARVIPGISNRRTEQALDVSCIDFDIAGPCYLDDTQGALSTPWGQEWEPQFPSGVEASAKESAAAQMHSSLGIVWLLFLIVSVSLSR